MADHESGLTLEECCWLWLLNEDCDSGADSGLAEKLESLIQQMSGKPRPLEPSEIRQIAVEWGRK